MLPRRLSTGLAYSPTGAMNQQITLLQRSSQRDQYGNFLSPIPFLICWAKIEPLTNKYTEKSEQVVTEATHRVVIRYYPGVTTAMTVQLLSGAIWNIEAIHDPDGRQVEQWLMCYERDDGSQ